MPRKIEVLIVGTGAVGSFYSGKLAQAGARVSALCRSDFDIVKERGITVKSINGDFHFKPAEVVNNIADYQAEPDYIIVATKALPEINTADIISEKVCSNTSIVMLQNGINIEDEVYNRFPENEVISGIAFICATRTAPALIEHIDYGRLIIGKYPRGSSENAEKLANLFLISGINCKVDDNIIMSRWKKLLWNAPFNPISVLGGGIDTKTIIESESSLKLVRDIMEEVIAIAEKSGYSISSENIQKMIDETIRMTPYKTSMLNDFENRRPMEVEAILGNTIRLAENYDLHVPCLKSIYALLSLVNEQNQKRYRNSI